MADKKRILIVEDERPMAKALQLKLINSGFDAVLASDGNEALEILAKEKFDLIIMDLIMPNLDGFGLLSQLVNKNTTPIVVASNLSQEEDVKRVKEMGAANYYSKADTPITLFVEKIKAFFSK